MASSTFRYLNKKELLATLGVSRATLERMVSDGTFPRPFKIGRRATRWKSDEVANFLNGLERSDSAYACRAEGKGGAAA